MTCRSLRVRQQGGPFFALKQVVCDQGLDRIPKTLAVDTLLNNLASRAVHHPEHRILGDGGKYQQGDFLL